MKMVHLEYTFQIEFKECIVQRLIVETPNMMSAIILELKNQIEGQEGKWVLSENGNLLKISNECELIMDIFNLDINNKKMLNSLYCNLEKEINSTDLLIQWNQVNTQLATIFDIAIDNLDYDVTYQDVELKSLFKLSNLKFRRDSNNYFEYLLQYLELLVDIKHIKLVVFVNITTFLTFEEIKYLYEHSFYKKYHLLLIDAQDIRIDDSMEKKIIIDKDYCIIQLNME